MTPQRLMDIKIKLLSYQILWNLNHEYHGALAQQLHQHVYEFDLFVYFRLIGLSDKLAKMQFIGLVWTRVLILCWEITEILFFSVAHNFDFNALGTKCCSTR